MGPLDNSMTSMTFTTMNSCAMIRSTIRRVPIRAINNIRSHGTNSFKGLIAEEVDDATSSSSTSLEVNNEVRSKQAPNRVETWSTSQRPRSEAMTGPRFEQIDFTVQPRPLAAIDLIAKQPIRYVTGKKAVCDGGNEGIGAQGHPKIYINVDKPGAHKCLYCGLRYAQSHGKDH